MRSSNVVVSLLTFMLCHKLAGAAPVLLSQTEFDVLTSGLPRIVEDFESFATNVNLGNPLILANGSFAVTEEFAGAIPFVEDEARFCGDTGQCLSYSTIASTRTFSAFPDGTAFWAADVHKGALNQIESRFTVVGGSGILELHRFNVPRFLAIHDPQGIISIQFESGGGTYITYDNVAVAIVPEPKASVLFLLGGLCAACCFAPSRGWKQLTDCAPTQRYFRR